MKISNEKYRILIIDDSVENIKVLSQLLEGQGYTTLQATNGKLGLEIASKAKPALIILDIKMPEIDGYEVCSRLKNVKELKNIPVIFISGLDSSIDKVKAFGIGGVDYITKPFQTEEVLARVKVQIELQAARNELEQLVAKRTASLTKTNIALKEKIEEQQKTEALLRENQELLALFIKYSPIHAYIKEVTPTSSRVLVASENFSEMVGIPGSEMTGKTMEELFPSDFAKKISADDWEVVYHGKLLKLDEDFNNRNYTTIKFPIVQGEKTILAGFTFDITERKQAEEALRLSQERLSLANKAATIGIWDWDIGRNELVWDESMYKLYGLNREGFANAYEAWLHCVHPDDAKRMDEEIQAAIRGEKEYAPEFRIIQRDGTVRNIQAASQTFRDKDGNAIRMIGTNVDITERKRAEEDLQIHKMHLEELVEERTDKLQKKIEEHQRTENALRESETLLAKAQKIGHLGSWNWNIINNTLTWSDEVYCIFGLKHMQFEVTYESFLDFVHPDDRDMVQEEVNHALNNNKPYSIEHRIIRLDNTQGFVHERGEVFRDKNGEPIQMIGTVLDITERKQIEAKIKEHFNELEMFNKAMVDRELRIIELKEEVNRLCEELGRAQAYPPIWNNSKLFKENEKGG